MSGPVRRWAQGRPRVGAIFGVVVLAALASAPAASSSGASERASASSSHTVWLCKPGQPNDPCELNSSSTSVSADGAATVAAATAPARSSKFDCFYVYPTVSTETALNSDLKVQPAEIAVARSQASRFSQVCKVWAPMYHQVTISALFKGSSGRLSPDLIAYDSLLSGWKDFLAHDDKGRPIVFIGHSQGAAILIRLLRAEIDPSPRLRKLMVSAIILGGNVQVPTGRTVGGSFTHVPLCASGTQTGCVIAYSTFGTQPPPNALFGRPGQGVSLQSGQASSGEQVACVNPATFSDASGALLPYFPSASTKVPGVRVTTPWVSLPGLYTGTCESAGGATWLQVTAASVPGDPRPKITPVLGPTWGYHLDDVNVALGNLVFDVALEEHAFH